MPLTEKGKKVKKAMEKTYGKERGEDVFYATEAKGKIKGMTKKMAMGGMTGYAEGGMKKVPESNTGLKKLPKDVRNKMGYMAKGGMTKKGYAKGGLTKSTGTLNTGIAKCKGGK